MDLTIGILGGMGTYATVHLFQQYADLFTAEKEWDRPRMIIDNRCTMPSRVRAILYNENVDKLVDEMADSMQQLLRMGCNRIVLACNTSHLFLPLIYRKVPQVERIVVNIIDNCVEKIINDKIKEVYLLASEGTIDSCVYQNALDKVGITCLAPRKNEYNTLRMCIEAVKHNEYNEDVKNTFLSLINRNNNCLLGCTELPVLYEKYRDEITCKYVYDPVYISLKKIYCEYEKKNNHKG